jgi:type VI secretion system protein ImpA
MPAEPLLAEDFLDPISSEQPCGADLRLKPEWDRIREARRSDDQLDEGNWQKKERKTANWRLVSELTSSALKTQTKDLQIAVWVTEAELKLHGFPGLNQGFRLLTGLMARYWEQGLYPVLEQGPEDRAGPLGWLNNKLVDAVAAVPITRRADEGDDYSLQHLRDAARLSEASFTDAHGEIDEAKKRDYHAAIASGRVSLEMFKTAVEKTRLAEYEQLWKEVEEVSQSFAALEKVVDEKFVEVIGQENDGTMVYGVDSPAERVRRLDTPNMSACRRLLAELRQEILFRLDKKRPTSTGSGSAALSSVGAMPLGFSGGSLGTASASNGTSWQAAEEMIRSGKIDAGLAAMTRLAAGETSGRNRFQRKLLLAEVCLASQRSQLARAILEELAGQIEEFKLAEWEASDLVGGVWSRLYALYKTESGDKDKAKELFGKLCRLDPWQALTCGE